MHVRIEWSSTLWHRVSHIWCGTWFSRNIIEGADLGLWFMHFRGIIRHIPIESVNRAHTLEELCSGVYMLCADVFTVKKKLYFWNTENKGFKNGPKNEHFWMGGGENRQKPQNYSLNISKTGVFLKNDEKTCKKTHVKFRSKKSKKRALFGGFWIVTLNRDGCRNIPQKVRFCHYRVWWWRTNTKCFFLVFGSQISFLGLSLC